MATPANPFGGSYSQESVFQSFPLPGDKGDISIQISGTDAILAMPANYRKAALPNLLKAIEKSLDATLRVLVPLTPLDLGEARKSYKPRFTGVTLANVEGEIYSDLDRMPALEFGRAPGSWPPQDKLESWARRKLGVRSRSSANPYTDIGYILARHIFEHGLKGHFMFEKTFDIIQPVVEQQMSDAIDKTIMSL